MNEVLPGIFHWTAFHEGIGLEVSSYFVAPSATLIDPMTPEGGLERIAERGPERIVLTNRHHYRHSSRFVERFGCRVLCHESGLHEFEDGPVVEGFSFGDQPAPAITALEIAAICPDETALEIADGATSIAFADGLVHMGRGTLAFVPDRFMGDDPHSVKQGLLRSFRSVLDREFDALLFAHGDPLPTGGKAALQAFVEAGK
jgi:hypothetical protein